MQNTINNQNQENLKGIFFMVLAVLILPFSDAIAKWLSSSYTIIQIAWLRFFIQAIILLILSFILKYKISAFKKKYIFVSFFISASIVFLFWGLKYLPLANNIALFFIEPLVLTLLSVIILKEKLQKNHIVAVIIGLIGTLIIIRPNWSAYGMASFFPIVSAIFYALYLISLRQVSTKSNNKSLQFFIGILSTSILSIIIIICEFLDIDSFGFNQIKLNDWWLILLLGIITTIVQLLVSKAFFYSKASSLASFQYLEIISASILGWLIFNHLPDSLTITGAGIVIFSGLYLIRHERRSIKK
ncbi:DMT family transporter [Arcobacter sp. YIC-310]|uniref:DMT family transporter n=1 Tax=Arcobacter sp. YIC-310 TaxID=3376632 RepID=UPI003C23DD30